MSRKRTKNQSLLEIPASKRQQTHPISILPAPEPGALNDASRAATNNNNSEDGTSSNKEKDDSSVGNADASAATTSTMMSPFNMMNNMMMPPPMMNMMMMTAMMSMNNMPAMMMPTAVYTTERANWEKERQEFLSERATHQTKLEQSVRDQAMATVEREHLERRVAQLEKETERAHKKAARLEKALEDEKERHAKTKQQLAAQRQQAKNNNKGAPNNKHHDKWNQKYQMLKSFFEKYGHANMSGRYEQEFPKLHNWVRGQRMGYSALQKGQATFLTTQRIQLLKQIGFDFEPQKERHDNALSFAERVDQLKAFMEQHGHCVVPQYYDEQANLGAWVKEQRKVYALDKLKAERVALLESLGFQWRVRGKSRSTRSGHGTEQPQEEEEEEDESD